MAKYCCKLNSKSVPSSENVPILNFSNVKTVTEELEAARKLRQPTLAEAKPKKKSQRKIKPLYLKKSKKGAKSKQLTPDHVFMRWEWPKPKKFKGCQHFCNIILDRDIFSHKEHIQYISMPKNPIDRSKPPAYYPKLIFYSIPPATLRINQLAQPKSRQLLGTWEEYGNSLSADRVDKIRANLQEKPVMSNKKAVEILKQMKQEERTRRRNRERKIDSARQKLVKKQHEQLREHVLRVLASCKDHLFSSKVHHLEGDQAKLADKVLRMIYRELKIKVPRAGEKDKYETAALKNLSIKVAVWLSSFLKNVGCGVEEVKEVCPPVEECEQEVDSSVEGFPIDDYISLYSEEEEMDIVEQPFNTSDEVELGDEDFGTEESSAPESSSAQDLVETIVQSLFKLAWIPGSEAELETEAAE